MQAKQAEQHNTRRENAKLDDRYGKIGIPAVAAAMSCRAKDRKMKSPPRLARESD